MIKSLITIACVSTLAFCANTKVHADVEKKVWVEPATPAVVAPPPPPIVVVAPPVIEKIEDKATDVKEKEVLPLDGTIAKLNEALKEAEKIKNPAFDYRYFKSEVEAIIRELHSF